MTSLYDHLSTQRIEAEHIFSIASGRYTKNIAATTEQITRALDKVGMSEEEFQRATGIPIQAFTGAELAAYSLNGAKGIEGFALRFDVKGNTGSGSMVPGADAGLAPTFSIGGMKAANWTKYQSQGRAFTGADGKPRFEMDASKATLNANAIKDPANYYNKPDFLTKNPLAFGFQAANLPGNEQQQPKAMAVAVERFDDEAGDLPLHFPGGGAGLCAGGG